MGIVATFAALGCVVEEADPGWDGADEAFETLRAFGFELGYGGLYDRIPTSSRRRSGWNIEAGRALSGPDIGRATGCERPCSSGLRPSSTDGTSSWRS